MAGFLVFIAVAVTIGFIIYFYTKDKKVSKPKMSSKDDMGLNMSYEELTMINATRKEATERNNGPKESKSGFDAHKVMCGYCDSYVDIEENELCPNCGASLKDEIEEVKRKNQVIELEMLKVQAEMDKDRKQNEKTQKAVNMARSAALNAVIPMGSKILGKRNKK